MNKSVIRIRKKPINADYSVSTENIESNIKAPKSKENDIVKITKYKNIFTLKIGQDKYLLPILFWKLISGHIKLKISMEKK